MFFSCAHSEAHSVFFSDVFICFQSFHFASPCFALGLTESACNAICIVRAHANGVAWAYHCILAGYREQTDSIRTSNSNRNNFKEVLQNKCPNMSKHCHVQKNKNKIKQLIQTTLERRNTLEYCRQASHSKPMQVQTFHSIAPCKGRRCREIQSPCSASNSQRRHLARMSSHL